jgi:hypothetical protein
MSDHPQDFDAVVGVDPKGNIHLFADQDDAEDAANDGYESTGLWNIYTVRVIVDPTTVRQYYSN